MVLKSIGGLVIALGLADCIGRFAGFDLWGIIGKQLPERVWSSSAYVEMALGYFLFKPGSDGAEEAMA